MNLQTSCKHRPQTGLEGGIADNLIFGLNGPNPDISANSGCKQPTENGCFAAVVENAELTPNDISVIRERYHGWERASAKTLAAVFGVSVQRIAAIVRNQGE